MSSRAFPLKTKKTFSIDSLSSPANTGSDAGFGVGTRVSGPVRSEVISRGRRVSVISFAGDPMLYSRYAVDTLGQKPLYLNPVKSVDGLRHPGFSGISPMRRRPMEISIRIPEVDFTALRELEGRFQSFGDDLSAGLSGFRLGITSGKTAYVPLVGAMALGMVSALFLEHSFGSGAKADDQVQYVQVEQPVDARVLGVNTEADADMAKLLSELSVEDPAEKDFENRVREMVKGYPIEDMVPYIVEQDRTVAIYLVAIAKKESAWGVHAPVLEGQDCFNYWGYRGIRLMMGTGGHTCFNSRKDAVETVAKRLHTLIYEKNLSTPEDLIVWKCGSSCAGHDPYSVKKWISDVDMYYEKLNVPEEGNG
jgi:hypothetical protein